MAKIPEDGKHDPDDQIFEVEKILSKRKKRGKVEFLVQWRGYGPEEDSWEPEENLFDCLTAIEAFNKEMKKGKSKTRQSRVDDYLQNSRKPISSGPSQEEDLTKYQILHKISSPPISPHIATKRRRQPEIKPAEDEKPERRNIKAPKEKSFLKILAAVTLFVLLILAIVQPVGIISKLKSA
ncbi:chromodomain Y-like protein 2 [Dendronephthya gigantea]|uniref:chromodomain Y-like protein 2 n=1 Tax=Dendronephthya gigantea TaxID=151771 RepID=UPI00106CAD08|nr:chromodomain Y-like protein 2 [Dendronephthya gigantea]